MSALFKAVNRETTVTENGMATLESSLDSVVDLFFKIGASRGKFDALKNTLSAAFATDPEMTVRVLLWSRDVRGGAGERKLFRDAILFGFQIGALTKEQGDRIVSKVPELGRFDDLYAFIGTPSENAAIELFAGALRSGNGLAAKWSDRKGMNAVKMRKAMGLTPKQYRKLVVNNTNVVEQLMCAKSWNSIEFDKLPSVAASRYQKAFWKNANESYSKYVESLKKGEAKINAGAVYPYDIVKSLNYGDKDVANQQWNSLPDYMEGTENRGILPVVDVSASMTVPAGGYGSGSSVTCLDVAVSLGLYLSERNRGIFKDQFITFSNNPQMHKLSGNLYQRYTQLRRADWQMSTDLEKVFKVVLDAAINGKVAESDMPETILILSDMQFNSAVSSRYGRSNPTSFEMISDIYKNAGYKMPNVVYWNINSKSGVPVEFDQSGTALVSGFSPSIMKSIIRAENVTPVDVMKQTIMDSRYDW
jgi:hypothetical protein